MIFLSEIKKIISENRIRIKEYNGYKTYSLYCEYAGIDFKFSLKFFNLERYGNPYLIYLDNKSELSWTNDISILLKKTIILKEVLIKNNVKFIKYQDDFYDFLDHGVFLQLYPSPLAMEIILSINL